MAQPLTTTSSQSDRGWFGHPRGLSTCFFTEMWERFSFYGLRALLVLYMTASVANGGLAFTSPKASGIVGWYGFGVYAAGIPGGWDGARPPRPDRTVVWGRGIIPLGAFTMAFPSRA